jgi:hypothetical protein
MADPESEVLTVGDGAVAVVDALGFREASKNHEGIARLVHAVRKTRGVTSDLAALNNLGDEAHIYYMAASDTIISSA